MTPERPVSRTSTPVTPPPRPLMNRPVRPLGWRNPWTMLLGALAAFQAGAIVTLVWTSGRGNDGAGGTGQRVAPVTLPGGTTRPPTPDLNPSPNPDPNPNPDPTPNPNPDPTPNPNPDPTPNLNPDPTPTPNPDPTPTPNPDPAPGQPSPPVPPGRKPRPTPLAPPPVAPPAVDQAAMVEVEIVSEPEGATVRIGGAVWGVTPLTALLPTAARVVVQLELTGHQPARMTWTPSSGRRTVRATLTPLESP